jgi:putative transposase
MKKRYTEEQIAHALRQVEAGDVATEVCRKMGVSEQTFYLQCARTRPVHGNGQAAWLPSQ